MKKDKRIKKNQMFTLTLAITLLVLIIALGQLKLLGFAVYQNQPDATEGKDTYIRNSSSLNFGSDIILKVGKTASGFEYRSLIFLNVSDVSSGSTILDSILTLYASTNNQEDMPISVYMITSDWLESESSWENNTASSLWSSSGGDYDDLVLLDTENIVGASQYYNFTITQAVRRWTNGTNENYGLLLVSNSAGNNNLTEFASSDNANPLLSPEIWVSYTSNAPPSIDLISTNSYLISPINVGQIINFTIDWTDLESDQAQIFVCNSSSISFPDGCDSGVFCNTSISSQTTQSCTYTSQQNNNRTTAFWVSVCDQTNCSSSNASNFYVNHFPNVTVILPNGGEQLNQSQGNYSVKFNVTDSDSDALTASLYYGTTQNSTTSNIIQNINLTNYCTDLDSSTSTQNNCTYSWNTQGIYGTYFITIIINDSFSQSNDSSNNPFNVTSIEDNQAPNITSQWHAPGNIYSGKMVQIYANVSDPNINTVWAEINQTIPQTVYLRNTTISMPELFNSSFIAQQIGTYQFRIYANDTLNNVNNSMEWIEFNVSKPSAETQNEFSPPIALPYSVIKVKGEISATDSLTSVYAYLTADSDFTFLEDYPQNLYLGNISNNTVSEAVWFISTPISQSSYTFNITYTDAYSNSWSSNNTVTNVTSTVGGNTYSLLLADYPHVAASYPYTVTASFYLNGVLTDSDTTEVSLYDPLKNLIVGPTDMLQQQTGKYNYTYNVPPAQTAGQWETIVNATINGVSYYSNSFWKLVGALFDVRNIQIIDAQVDELNITVESENVGNNPTDLTLIWNLTRVDNDAVLDFGSETFAVGEDPVTWSVSPSTSYVGQVKITFVGYYSQTEKAGAYEVFSTTSANTTTPSGGSGGGSSGGGAGGGGGGGGGATTTTTPKEDITTNIQDEILVAKNIKEKLNVVVTNNGKEELNDVSLLFNNLNTEYYTISPNSISGIKSKESAVFVVEFLVSDFIGEKEFEYIVRSNTKVQTKQTKLVVMMPLDYIKAQLAKIKDRTSLLRSQTSQENVISQLDSCEIYISNIEKNIENQEILDAGININNANSCLDLAEKMNTDKAILGANIKIGIYKTLLAIAGLALLILLIIVVYKVYRKLSLLFFIKRSEEYKPSPTAKKEDFEDKIKKIEDKLKD